jgi:hypothetical protein
MNRSSDGGKSVRSKSAKTKTKEVEKTKRPAEQKQQDDKDHREEFGRLLDDAVLGIKKKPAD